MGRCIELQLLESGHQALCCVLWAPNSQYSQKQQDDDGGETMVNQFSGVSQRAHFLLLDQVKDVFGVNNSTAAFYRQQCSIYISRSGGELQFNAQ